MININYIKDLLYLIPDLLDLFLSGFIFMSIYKKIMNKKIDIQVMFLWCLLISYLIKSFYSLMHGFVLTDYNFNENFKVMIYSITGCILPFVFAIIYRSELFRKTLLKINYQTINDDIFDDLIDYDDGVLMTIYLKDSNICYAGTFVLKEEKGKDSFVSLIKYVCMNAKTWEVIYKPSLPSSVVFNLNDVERIELTYNDDSKVWKRLNSEN